MLMASSDLLTPVWCISFQLMWSLTKVVLDVTVVLVKVVGGGVVAGAPPVNISHMDFVVYVGSGSTTVALGWPLSVSSGFSKDFFCIPLIG